MFDRWTSAVSSAVADNDDAVRRACGLRPASVLPSVRLNVDDKVCMTLIDGCVRVLA